MKAIVYRTYGSPNVLHVEETATPTPTDDQVLIRVRAASVNPYDWHFMRGSPYIMRMRSGLTRPKDLRVGVDVAGVVERVGSKVTRFKSGDAVLGGCRGAFAEYACAADTSIVAKPANVTFEQAATVAVAGYTALQGLRDQGKIQRGHNVLVNGASGGVGTFAVQIAKSFGARVTGVCSTRNLDLVHSLGADRVIDYTREDFTRRGECYDVVFDIGADRSSADCERVLTPNGKLVLVGAPKRLGALLGRILGALVMRRRRGGRIMLSARARQEDLVALKEFAEAGKLSPVIDRTYPLREVPEAFRYFATGRIGGKIVISVA